MESSWRVNMVEGNKKYAEANLPDVELIITNGENNASKQVSDVESLIAQGVKVADHQPGHRRRADAGRQAGDGCRHPGASRSTARSTPT